MKKQEEAKKGAEALEKDLKWHEEQTRALEQHAAKVRSDREAIPRRILTAKAEIRKIDRQINESKNAEQKLAILRPKKEKSAERSIADRAKAIASEINALIQGAKSEAEDPWEDDVKNKLTVLLSEALKEANIALTEQQKDELIAIEKKSRPSNEFDNPRYDGKIHINADETEDGRKLLVTFEGDANGAYAPRWDDLDEDALKAGLGQLQKRLAAKRETR